MSIKFREHRWWLDESMQTVKEVSSQDELISNLNEIYEPFGKAIASLKFKAQWFDDRPWVWWDTYMVIAKFEWDNWEGVPVWYTNWLFDYDINEFDSYESEDDLIKSERYSSIRERDLEEKSFLWKITDNEKIELQALRDFPHNEEAQKLLIKKWNWSIGDDETKRLNAIISFPYNDQRQELHYKRSTWTISEEELMELDSIIRFPENTRLQELDLKRRKWEISEEEQLEIDDAL